MKTFKKLMLLSTLVLTLSPSSAFACAGCLDLYPEVVVLDRATTKSIIDKAPLLKESKKVSLRNITCTEMNPYERESDKVECSISGMYQNDQSDFKISFEKEGALALNSRLKTVTGEFNGGDSDDWVRSGKRMKISLLSQTYEKTSVSIPLINMGELRCFKLNKEERCEIELNVLTGFLYYSK